MSRYWIIAPSGASDPKQLERVWAYDLEKEIISIGWGDIGPIDNMSREELKSHVRSTYPNYAKTNVTRVTNMLWSFHNEIEPGDIVIARKGRTVIAAIGEVKEKAAYIVNDSSHNKSLPNKHNRILYVEWRMNHRDVKFPSIVFGMQTLYGIDEEKFNSLIAEDSSNTESENPLESSSSTEFVLEKYLEDFIVNNFTTIFKNELKLYTDPVEEAIGQQFNTGEVGTIDILAQESKSGDFVVIELKKGQGSDKVMGQILRYMGWVQENLATEGQKVKGIIICHEPDTRLSYAVKMTQGISIKSYKVSFALSDAF